MRTAPLLAALLAVVVLPGCSSPGRAGAVAVGSPAATATPSPSPVSSLPPFRSSRTLVQAGRPVRLRVPALGIDAPVGRVGRAADGTVQVPSRWEQVGWFDAGARPGEAGPAVLLGHVDSTTGPAVFVRLPAARPGDVVEVADESGAVRRFRVTRVARYPKVRFPTEAVYLPVLRPELRLVTCGGSFDRSTGHYRDNVVVFADLVA